MEDTRIVAIDPADAPDPFDVIHADCIAGRSDELLSKMWDIPFSKYISKKDISSHGLMDILRSPAHYYAHTHLGLDKDTPAKKRGRLVHTAVLEPKRFRENYKVAPAEARNTTIGKNKYAKFIMDLKPHDIVVQPDEVTQITAMIRAMKRHQVAWNLILHGISEQCGWWRDEKGYLCKWRPDKTIERLGIVIDYKTARDASFEAFRRDMFNYKYDMQAYWYCQGGMRRWNKPVRKFIFIAQEPEEPYAVGVYVANDVVYEVGEKRTRIAKMRYEQCLEREVDLKAKGKPYDWEDVWNAYPPEAVDIDLPHYAMSQVEDVNDV